ncbi:chloride channel protein [Enterococcus alcedinis]|uniref:Chloride channel protein n=1 Tax=Enterococcus alcedinis TaxID=1274384 RepID=A0A917JHB1_9ENTE|nr:chloride channel protein [Enterococcus alcedinis]
MFLVLVNFLIHSLWETIPTTLQLGNYYPLILGLIGGTLVGFTQRFLGPYPHTLEETLHEFKATNAVAYKHAVTRNFFAATIVLAFGASLGPEAALSSILGGMISWLGDQMKLTLARKEQLVNLSIGTMLSAIFHAPFVGISDSLEEELKKDHISIKWKKVVVYGLATIFGIIGFTTINQMFPKESVLGIHIPIVIWQSKVLFLIVPAIVIGLLFGYLFLMIEKISNQIAKKINHPFILAITAGLLIGLLGMISPYFLFSGEHELLPFSKSYKELSRGFLLFLAIGKVILTNLCFAFGWRGGKIFPAIFSSAAIAFTIVSYFPYTPGLIVGIVVAASVTIILKQPLVTAALLLFLFPIQFFPIIVLVCYLAKSIDSWIEKRS